MTNEQKQKIRDSQVCYDCGINVGDIGEYPYMVHSHLWPASNIKFLCVSCLENRLARELHPSDFTDALINRTDEFKRSERLARRQGC